MRDPQRLAEWNTFDDRSPQHLLVGTVDLVAMRIYDEPSVLYGRCLHRGGIAGRRLHRG